MELIIGDGIIMLGKYFQCFFLLIFLCSFLSCNSNKNRERFLKIIEHDYSQIDNYEDLYKEFAKQKFVPCSADYYAYRMNKNEDVLIFYNIEAKLLYISLEEASNHHGSEEVIQEYLNILDIKYGKHYSEEFQISQEYSSNGRVIIEKYSKVLPYWKTDKFKIYFYKYEGEPEREYYYDGYPTFIVKQI